MQSHWREVINEIAAQLPKELNHRAAVLWPLIAPSAAATSFPTSFVLPVLE